MNPQELLNDEQLDAVLSLVTDRAANLHDIYPLSPLQEGMLFHSLLDEQSDAYILSALLELQSGTEFEALIQALQAVIDRHDVLRTAIVWERLPRPMQVVWRRAKLRVERVPLADGHSPLEQLREEMLPGRRPLDLRYAPLVRLLTCGGASQGRRYALLQVHHIVCDYQSLSWVLEETITHLLGREGGLPRAVPFRNYVEHTLASAQMHNSTEFFRDKLQGYDTSAAPFGLFDVHGGGHRLAEARLLIEGDVGRALRARAREAGTSAARMFHAAWALVLGRTSGREDVTFGTVLLARNREQSEQQRMLGMAINTLPLRLRLRDRSAVQLLQDTHVGLTQLQQHVNASLAISQRSGVMPGAAPLFTSLFNYRMQQIAARIPLESGVQILARGEAWTNYPITVTVDDLGDPFELTVQTDPRIDPRRVAGYLRTAVLSLAEALQREPHSLVRALPVLPEEEELLIRSFNTTHASYPEEKLIHELFEEQVERTPHEIAVICAGRHLTYRQLNARANQLAHYLTERGVAADNFVGLCVERGIDMLIGMLGILKAGAAYVPLDSNYPSDRLEFIVRDTAPVAILTLARLRSLLPSAARVFVLDELGGEIALRPTQNITRSSMRIRSANLAYAIYTSGSTGQPKGVAIEHREAVNMIWWALGNQPPEVFERSLQSTSLNFDLSVYECFVPLSTGGMLCIVENALALLSERTDVTLINTVPSAIRAILDSGEIPPSVRVINLAGEPLKRELVERIFSRSTAERVCNLYGPSETTTYSTALTMRRESGFASSIGSPIANTQIHILNGSHQLVPIGVEGEIYISGAGVARGYINRPELTAERFLSNPFSQDAGERMYRTGDIGRWQQDGTIEYLGRNDHQIKIRGFRIEPGEIEAQLAGYPRIRQAVVIAREDDLDRKRLVAYVVPKDISDAPDPETLSKYLRRMLPEHMIPAAFVVLDRFPLTPNGKLDRRALPIPEINPNSAREYEPPRGAFESSLAQIWQDLLLVDRVGRHDNFFELGGHSLLLVQLLDRLRREGFTLDLRQILQRQTLADMASMLERRSVDEGAIPPNAIPADCTFITPQMLPLIELRPEHIALIVAETPGGAANIEDIYPLTSLQEGILFHHRLNEQSDTYVLPILLSVSSQARMEELTKVLQAVIQQFDILRTAVLWEGLPQPVQVVSRVTALPVEVVQLSSTQDVRQQLDELLHPQLQRFDIRKPPLLRLKVAADPTGDGWYALLQLHHITVDHVTLEILASQIMAHLRGATPLHFASPPFRNHVALTRGKAASEDARSFFRRKFGDVKETTAPFGLLDARADGSNVDEANEALDVDLARRVRSVARRLSVSPATLFHSAWGVVVGRTSGRDDVVFGSLLIGRMQAAVGGERTLGMFINTLPVRLQLGCTTVQQLVEQTHGELLALLAYDQTPLAIVQRCSSVPESAPLFTALLNYRHSVSSLESQWSAAPGIKMLALQERTNYPLTITVDDYGTSFAVTAHTDRSVSPQRAISYLRTALASLTDALECTPQAPVYQLPIMPRIEYERIIRVFNEKYTTHATRQYAHERFAHELFEEQVQRVPGEFAVIHEDRSLTYADLNRNANQLAHYLRHLGLGPDRLVGIFMTRKPEMVVGVLGILKCGAAYLPLDPNHPEERLKYMLEDASPSIVLTQSNLKERLPTSVATVISVDTECGSLMAQRDTNLKASETGLRPNHLAYMIYTSGSTGLPKGVMVEHAGLTNYLQWVLREYRPDAGDAVPMISPLAFDATVTSLYSPLMCGRSLWMIGDGHELEGLERLLERSSRWSLVKITPAHLQVLCNRLLRKPLSCTVGAFVIGGEALSPATVHLLRSIWPEVRVINEYGPTETVVGCSAYVVPRDWKAAASVPIGSPIANARMYILDKHRQPVPIGVVGEIYIGGAGVARGYLNRPELTAERFVTDPFGEDQDARMYKSGDLGRWCADGTIEYFGRNDDQVKIRGFRVEPAEVEAQLLRHPRVKEAVVIAPQDTAGETHLVAYVVAADVPEVRAVPLPEELRGHLKTRLPEYMVPSAFIEVSTIPLTSNGKVDRTRLPKPGLGDRSMRSYVPPQGELEQEVASMWEEVFRIERIGRNDNFFELGGHSLVAMQVCSRVEAMFAIDVPVRLLFGSPTVKQFSEEIEALRRAHILTRIDHDGVEAQELLKSVASMPKADVSEMLSKLLSDGRSL